MFMNVRETLQDLLEQARRRFREAAEALDDLLSPEPELVPVPVRPPQPAQSSVG